MTMENRNYENRVRNMSIDEARTELAEWEDSYHCASRDEVPDEDYLNKCIYYSGFIEAHIQLLEEGYAPSVPFKEYRVTGYESMEKTAGPGNATSSRVNLPAEWRGKRVHIVRLDP